MEWEALLGAWVAAGLTLFILTFLYEDNPLFKLAEHLYVGISLGYTVVKGYELLIRLVIDPVTMTHEWSRLIPVMIGLLMLARYVPRLAWLSRIAFAFIVGVGSGLAIPRLISSNILKQVEDTVRPLVAFSQDGALQISLSLTDPSSSLNSMIILIGVLSVLFYFFFSVEHTGAGRVAALSGIVFLMLAFGAAFGYTAMARLSLLIGRLRDLIEFSGPAYHYATLWLLGVTVLILLVAHFLRRPAQVQQE